MGERAIDTSEPVTEGPGATVDPLPTGFDTTVSKSHHARRYAYGEGAAFWRAVSATLPP